MNMGCCGLQSHWKMTLLFPFFRSDYGEAAANGHLEKVLADIRKNEEAHLGIVIF